MFIATFMSNHYPEDNRILGVFSSEEKAEECIKDYMRTDKNIYPKFPARYQQKRAYYNINECDLDEPIFAYP